MKLLGIESSGMTASVAVIEDDRLLAEYTIDHKKTHSQTLLPMLQEMTAQIELDLQSLDAIAISGGPGSFTGLRIGSATAKGMGLALNKPLIHVPTLEAMAMNAWGSQKLICPMMDARRESVYTGLYRFDESTGEMKTVLDQTCLTVRELAQKLNDAGEPVLVLGDGMVSYDGLLNELLTVPWSKAPAGMNRQRAVSVCLCGLQRLKAGQIETAAEHRPDYLKVSQAEREREQKLAKEQDDAKKQNEMAEPAQELLKALKPGQEEKA